ncbi:hypothetical protein [Candidatus Tisiphia endosymbiont of Empis tessellata]|uniref:hypothetical protein n=1 Tax=Candidatus Tisiphia endosymbiont of Empis tessellata TaxID=3066259 RepID=UPI00397784F6
MSMLLIYLIVRFNWTKRYLEAIIENPISELDLSSNNLGDNGAKVVAGIIQNSTKLKILKLSNNQIGSEGMGALSSAFDHNETVTDLDLSNNNLGDKGAEKVATLLANNSTIIDINLDSNEFGTDGLLYLPFSLLNRNNTTNISLDAADYIPKEAVARFAKVLQQNGNVHSINFVDKEQNDEKAVHAQKLFDTIIKIRDSNGLDKESQKEFNKLVWECIVPHPKWKDLFKNLVTDSKKPYLFDPNTLDTDGKPMLSKVSNVDIFSFVVKHESANKSKVVQQGELPPLDEKWFDTTVRVDDALSLENAAAQNVTESLLTSAAGNEDLKGAYARLNDIPDSPSLEQRMQAKNLRDYLVDTLTPSLEEGAEMRTITGDHSDPLTMTILGDNNPHLDLLIRTIVHGQDVSTTDRLSSVAPKKAILEHKDNPKMQTEAKKLGETMSPYMASTSQSNATPNTGKKHRQSSGFTR